MSRHAAFLVALALSVASAVTSCTPAQGQDAINAAPALVGASCVLLHAFAHSGTADQVCATAEDLAPFVGAVLASRGSDASARKVSRPVALVQVAELPRPASSVPARRCVAWETDDAR